MQPRDLHRPQEKKNGVVSCLQGSCLLFVLGLVYAALRAQPAEGPAIVYEHTPALRPVQGTSHVEAREPAPHTFAEVRPVAPTPVPRAVAEVRPTPPPQEGGPGRSLPAVKRAGSQAGATGLTSAPAPGLRALSPLPQVYLDHLSYMDKHPGNGKAATVDSWKAGVGGYDRGLGSRQAELLAIAFQSGLQRLCTAPAPPLHRPRTASAPPPHHSRTGPVAPTPCPHAAARLRQAGAMPTRRPASRPAAPPAFAPPRPPCSPATPGTSATAGAPLRVRRTAVSAFPRWDAATARATGGGRRARCLCSLRWRDPSASTAGACTTTLARGCATSRSARGGSRTGDRSTGSARPASASLWSNAPMAATDTAHAAAGDARAIRTGAALRASGTCPSTASPTAWGAASATRAGVAG